MRNTIAINPKWLIEFAPSFYRKASATEITQNKRNQKIKPLARAIVKDPNSWKITQQRLTRL